MNYKEIRSDITYKRTYSREKDNGTYETWEETIDRVINHQQWIWERELTHKILKGMPLRDITPDMREWVALNKDQILELEKLRDLLYNKKAILAGRVMWLGGTEISKRRESSMFNCSFAKIETIYDLVDLFWLLLQGAGVGGKSEIGTLTGFRSVIPELEIIRSKKEATDKGRENNEEYFIDGIWTISIGDSAESWSKAIGKLIANKYKAKKLVIDLSEIRGAGGRLKGYGWISSGDEQLAKAFPRIFKILNNKAGNLLSKLDIIEILNLLGSVLSSRRSAEITFIDYGSEEWKEFARFKKDCYLDEFNHRQQSNNSLIFWQKPSKEELEEVFNLMQEAGGSEPGIINGEAMKKRAPYASGLNPCAEILLVSKGFCNLVEINTAAFKGDIAGLHNAVSLLARANYRQTCVDLRDEILQEAWHLNNEFLRLCGVSLTGIAERDDLSEYDLKNLRYSAVMAARSMAKELDTPFPKNVTCVKPSGTVSKVMGCTEGIHKPLGKYIFNWINFSKYSPLVLQLKNANYRTMPNPDDSTGILCCLPINWEDIEFDLIEVERNDGTIEIIEGNLEPAIKQLERYKKYQVHWSDQNVSNTISYSPEEIPEIIEWLLNNWDNYVGVSFLYRTDPTRVPKDLGYNYLPQEVVTKEKFNEYIETLKEIDFETDTNFEEELLDEECLSGMCPVR